MPKKHTFLPYTKARAFARSLRLKNRAEWQHYAKSHTAELEAAGVPRVPDVYYLSPQAKYERDYGYKEPTDPATANIGAWVDWHDWLGSSYAPRMNAQFLTLTEFIAFVRKRRLTTQALYQRWRKKHYDTPDYHRTPGAPSAVYAGFTWTAVSATTKVSWSDRPQRKGGAQPQQYAPFREVRRAVRTLDLRKREHWFTHVKDDPQWLRKHQCPAHPERVAQYSGDWHGWADFLGSDTRANHRYKRD
jgi:hypothetical protein